MNPYSLQRLQTIEAQLLHLTEALANLQGAFDLQQHQELSTEFSKLKAINDDYQTWKKLQAQQEEVAPLCQASEAELREMALEEQARLHLALENLTLKIESALLPKDGDEDASCYLEIRSGTGGEEASLFCSDLYRMYHLYAQSRGWALELQGRSITESGGLREICLKVTGKGAFGRFRYESGGHRVQRVPTTESQGRIHTSACSVLVLPEMPKQAGPELKPSELRIDTFRASGAGGQHVNKTDSAVRITHLPTGLVATCQNGRSQHQNRESAMAQLLSRLVAKKRTEERAAEQAMRSSLLSNGSRTDRIRTYNFPQNRVTDHRIGLTLYQLETILEGKLESLFEALTRAYEIERLAHFHQSSISK